ncbi:hypothetical protein CRUP_027928 [Coryphaenoides rupestris]|nr:hypothetical protein CRUP_027928 [Coryphaenoides rupestris]
MSRRVAVIGAGSSGLVCIKTCLEEGLDPVCFESSHDIGGLWRFKFPNYMHHSLIIEYFRAYAEHFQLTKHIRFQTRVLQVKPRADFSQSGQWDVETESSEGNRQKHIFDAVMVCIGHHCQPNLPLHDFPEPWRGKKVVVIGIGNSGGDIAVELSRVTKQVYLSTRRGAWILNRVGEGGLPTDMSFNRVFNFVIWLLPFNFLCSLGESRLNMRFNHRLYNLQPKHRLFSQHPTVNDELPNRVLSGTVQIKPNIRRFQGSSVEFYDGSIVEDVDLVVFATGYSFSFPFLSSSVLPVSGNKASLYKYVFPPALDRNTLAVIGLVQPLGAIMPISEIQARWATRVFKGCVQCPASSVMMQDVQCKQEAMARRYVSSPRHTIQVDFVSYMDEVADQLGVRPSMLRLLLTDPRLAHSVILGPATPYQYRLRGPGRWAGARQAILTQWDRVARPMKTNECSLPEPRGSAGGLWVLLSAGVLAVASYYHRSSLASLLQEPGSLAGDLVARVEGLLPAWGAA